MSFLDSLENNLKALERLEEKDPEAVRLKQEAEQAERAAALAAAPWADQLKNGAFTAGLLEHCMILGHGLRMKVRPTWLGSTLRLEAREKQLDLVPTADGIRGRASVEGEQKEEFAVDLTANPKELAERWLKGV